MNKVIIVTGASSGFGLMAAQSLAKAGHTVFAGMRATMGRNPAQVEAEVARAIVKIIETPPGKRPFRIHIDLSQDGAEIVNGGGSRPRGALTPHGPRRSLESVA